MLRSASWVASLTMSVIAPAALTVHTCSACLPKSTRIHANLRWEVTNSTKETAMTILPNHATDLIVAEIHKTFGRPPMVRNEDANAYDHILGLVIEAQQPTD